MLPVGYPFYFPFLSSKWRINFQKFNRLLEQSELFLRTWAIFVKFVIMRCYTSRVHLSQPELELAWFEAWLMEL
ncbi:hypothetical protein L6452_17831 [Arctium lappa]|uniref:Uncharacterized protein n=1 Tax=Arctium lappa TaxID=4217 RepID=A0ACB9C4H0_ARCLA|nr:hypothetical protein L6452_17831 [Arctium lappa]